MNNYEQLDFKELKEFLLERISVVEVHQRYSGFVNRRGTMSNCPFCGEDKFYETRYNKFKCYNIDCNNQGLYNIYDYYMKKFGVDFFTALISLAKDFNYISVERADRILSKNYKKGAPIKLNKEVVQQTKTLKELDNSAPHQSPEVINNVYEAMSEMARLQKNELIYLRDERELPLERIVNDYFTMPNMYGENGPKFMDTLIKYIGVKHGYTEDKLIGVPGFYRDENGNVTFISRRGIAMKARNVSGLINGIQIRNYDYITDKGVLFLGKYKDGKQKPKYLWVSSRGLKDGCSCVAVVDTLIPKDNIKDKLYITEGKFKSEVISRVLGVPVIALPGVKQWGGVLDSEIAYIDEKIKKINNIFVCFDADLGTNLDVYEQLKSMTEKVLLKYKAEIKMIVWNEVFGKGLDDLILHNNKDKYKEINYSDYMKEYDIFLKELRNKYTVIGCGVYYKNTKNKVNKDELNNLYSQVVLTPLGIPVE